ncbi:hypothetical protein NLG97_g1219 [Lecanicillium saksenae]|uniref:Uncharacterized protein n=1 Tax=Lecanicillium saksenae TaxID=468837 RepID=A0ACC1R4C4_9HYPO|nr:hypothetical protein NLG97_g1219 [Lecanicillium saksenae]
MSSLFNFARATLPPHCIATSFAPDLEIHTSNRSIADELQGRSLHIPSLSSILAPLAAGTTPGFDELKHRINSRLDAIVECPVMRKKVDAIDLPLQMSRWYPYSSLDNQELLALYNLWLFVWDDVFDGEDAQEIQPADMGSIFEETMDYVKFHLGLADSPEEPQAPTPATALFQHAGKLIKERCDLEQRQRFFREVEFYVLSCAHEHKTIASGILPSLQHYWEYRLGTTSVYTGCALADLMAGVRLPWELIDTEEMQIIWTEVNLNVIIVNDILSLKKEMHGSVHSLLPIFMNETGKDMDAAAADIINRLRFSVENFTATSQKLFAMVGQDKELQESLAKYLELLEYNMTGNYTWR